MEALDLLPGGKKCCGEKGGREGSWHGGGACVCACVGECDLHVGIYLLGGSILISPLTSYWHFL